MAPESRDEVAQDEVRQRIDSLYDQAENATGNYNATRAMSSLTRSRGVPVAKRPGRRPDPALDEVARQWFDGARAKFGPTVPAVLPADRLPDRPATATGRSRDRGGLPGGTADALGVNSAARRPALERAIDRTVAELTAGRATDPESLALAARESGRAALGGSRRLELPSAGAELPTVDGTGAPGTGATDPAPPGAAALAGPDTRGVPAGLGRVDAAGLGPVYPAGLGTAPAGDPAPVETAVLPAAAPSAVQGTPVQEPRTLPGPSAPGRPSAAASKASNQRKLAAASDVITRYTARLTTAAATAQAAVVTATPPASFTATPPASATDIPPASVPATPSTPMPATAAPTASVAAAPPAPPTAVPFPPPAQPVSQDPAPSQWQQPEWAALGAPATPLPGVDVPPVTQASVTGTASFPAVPESPRAVRAAKAIAFARAQIGKPCVWGATGPDSYDCSSLTQAAWKAAGVPLPRAAYEQALAGAPVTLAGMEPGDLVLFFDDDRHVGLHVGGGMMVHAPGPGSSIREESIYGAGESAIHRIVRPA